MTDTTTQPSRHLDAFLTLPKESWETLGNLGPYERNTALEDIEEFRQDECALLLAVIDKQKEAAGRDGFAGVYGLIEYDEEYMVRRISHSPLIDIRALCSD